MWEDLHDTNLETQGTPHKSHDAIKGGKDDGYHQEAEDGQRSNGNLHDAAEVHGAAHETGGLGNCCRV